MSVELGNRTGKNKRINKNLSLKYYCYINMFMIFYKLYTCVHLYA